MRHGRVDDAEARRFGRRTGLGQKPKSQAQARSSRRRSAISVYVFSLGLIAGAGFAALIGLGFAAPALQGGAQPGVVQAGKTAFRDAPPRVLEARGWVVYPQNGEAAAQAQLDFSEAKERAVLELDLTRERT